MTIHAHGVSADRGVSQNFEPGGVGFGAQPGGVWVKVLPCDTHRGAPKILEGGGGKKISSAAEGGKIFVFC